MIPTEFPMEMILAVFGIALPASLIITNVITYVQPGLLAPFIGGVGQAFVDDAVEAGALFDEDF
jgi:hypothetical protein